MDIYNRSSDSHSIGFTYVPRDSTPPTVFFKAPSENSSFEIGYVEFSGEATDESSIAFVEYRIGDASWKKAIGKEQWSFRELLDNSGINSVFVRVTDSYGNTSDAVELKITILDSLEFVFSEPDSDELKNGKLILEVSWNRELDSVPQVILSGVTNDFETEIIDNKKMIIKADLGAGKTNILIYGFLNGKVEKSTNVEYKAVVSLTIGSDLMVVGRNIIKIPEPALIVDGRLYIPFRSMGEAFGAKVSWDADTKTAKYQLGDYSYEMTLNSSTAKVNGGAVEMSNVPLIIRDRMMIPVRAVSEVLGAKVDYDAETRTATITLPNPD
ncbi:MAG: stalk domain-containing protein [Caldisericia bacterium]